MLLLKHFIKSFRKFFQFPKKKIKIKSKARKKNLTVSKKKPVLKRKSISSPKMRKVSLKPLSQGLKNTKNPKHKIVLKEDIGQFIGNVTHFFTV